MSAPEREGMARGGAPGAATPGTAPGTAPGATPDAAPGATKRLTELAKTVRSKNAGVDKITFDIIFQSRENYELVKDSGVLSKAFVARLYGIDEGRITDFVTYDPAYAIKFTILRRVPSGSAGDADIFGAQQYAPLLDVEIPVKIPVR